MSKRSKIVMVRGPDSKKGIISVTIQLFEHAEQEFEKQITCSFARGHFKANCHKFKTMICNKTSRKINLWFLRHLNHVQLMFLFVDTLFCIGSLILHLKE